MQQMNIHKNKLIALLEAAFALIGMFLVWTSEKYPAQLLQQQQQQQQFNQFDQQGLMNQVGNAMTTTTQNGFNSWGWLALIGILVVVVATLAMNHFSLDYNANSRMVVIGGFTLIALGALIYFFRLNSVAKDVQQALQQRGVAYSASAGMGLWSTLIAGLVGIAWVSGLLNKLSPQARVQQGYPQYPYQQNNYQQPQYGQPPYQGNYPPQQQYQQQQPYPPQQQQPYPPQQQPPYPTEQQQQQQPYPPQQPPYPDQQSNYPQNPPAGNQQYPPQQQAPPNYQQGPPPPPPPPGNPYI